jgi:hypothetical protein
VKEGFDLRGENQGAVLDRVVQRLYAEPVARQEELAFPLVPDREGKHAVEVVDAIFPEFLIEVLAARAEAVKERDRTGGW